jgi:hypothetical protein
MDDEYVAEVVTDITVMVRGGLTVEAAIARQARHVPAAVLAKAKTLFEASVGLIRSMDDPGAVLSSETRKNAWYSGPQATDFFWPAVQAEFVGDLGKSAVSGIDSASTRVLSSMRAPGVPEFATRGLVLGYVQSGKTTNFISVIAKAADAGYRIFIVLSGITENLRSQTQSRVDSSLIDQASERWYRLTDIDSDFRQTKENAAALLGASDLRFIAVVKKNPARLRRLRDWLDAAGPIQLANCPILLIDDEADQASIDVGPKGRASRINGLMREILRKPKAAYVAYTATPFANLLMETGDQENLYPRDFIVPLPEPDGYFGSERIFGLPEKVDHDDPESDGLNLVRTISSNESKSLRPPTGKGAVYGWQPSVEPGLREAIDWFVLATAARRVRGRGNIHSSMLLHTSMLAEAHVRLAKAATDYLTILESDISVNDSESTSRLREMWEGETVLVPSSDFGYDHLSFGEIEPQLLPVLKSVRVVVDNYLSNDRLAYDDETPSTAIVVGGNTLSRGLTLEGLVSSYFVRSASAYDTLLQMGRWFGYRKGYEDLVRIWMTAELQSWFMDLSLVEADIRREILRYEMENLTPGDVAVRIRSHPSMAITAASKMRHAVRAQMSYSEKRPQTILFDTENKAWLQENIDAVIALVNSLRESGFEQSSFHGRRGFRNVDAADIMRFLTKYQFHRNSQSVKADLLRKYIDGENKHQALLRWNIVFVEREPDPTGIGELDLGLDSPVHLLQRSKLNLDVPWANVKSVVSTIDRVADLDWSRSDILAELERKGQKLTDSALMAIRDDVLGPQGLMCIYPIDKNSQPAETGRRDSEAPRVAMKAQADVMGIALFFPTARSGGSEIEYFSADLSDLAFESVEDELDQITAADNEDDVVMAAEVVQ